MIKEISVEGLYGDPSRNYVIRFNNDLTLISGKNGCGKTTLLKLIWYTVSPNIERVYEEFNFLKIHTITTDYELILSNSEEPKAEIIVNGDSNLVSVLPEQRNRSGLRKVGSQRYYSRLEEINDRIRNLGTSSLFFPTFRRFEENGGESWRNRELFTRISSSIARLSDDMSVDDHRYIASVSTSDIRNLITQKYAALSENALMMRDALLGEISQMVVDNAQDDTDSRVVLEKILGKIDDSNYQQIENFSAYESLKETVSSFVSGKGIQITSSINWGDVDNAIKADSLSAGEKQVLGFLAYNAFFENTPIIIDEPELSLHVDWQRQLVPALLSQGTSNQFIMATHSPFIYSRYPEKEVLVGGDRGE